MIDTNCNFVNVYNIDSAWRESMLLCVKNGHDFLVKGGSYVGQIRKQLDHITIKINNPGDRPMAPLTPPSIPRPTSDKKILDYFCRYIIGDEKTENEEYTYGEFISSQIPRIIDLLEITNGNTNQATICIGDKNTTFLSDPPCLRSISFKVVERRLNMCVYFRSWDLFSGLPENLGGLQLLKEYILEFLPRSIQDGKIIAFSDGLHLYEQYFPLVDQLNIDKIQINQEAINQKLEFEKEHGQ